jgi:hypothetical protein
LGGDTYSRFESDYWCTSYRAATEWVNEHTPQAAVIEVGDAGTIDQAVPFARSDLFLVDMAPVDQDRTPSYAIVCDGKAGLLNLLPGAPVLMTIERGGAVLAEVKDLRSSR